MHAEWTSKVIFSLHTKFFWHWLQSRMCRWYQCNIAVEYIYFSIYLASFNTTDCKVRIPKQSSFLIRNVTFLYSVSNFVANNNYVPAISRRFLNRISIIIKLYQHFNLFKLNCSKIHTTMIYRLQLLYS